MEEQNYGGTKLWRNKIMEEQNYGGTKLWRNKIMQTYEFDTVINNGIIQIPEQYLSKQLSSVRVILVANHIENHKRKKFTAMKINTKGFQFNREEANAR